MRPQHPWTICSLVLFASLAAASLTGRAEAQEMRPQKGLAKFSIEFPERLVLNRRYRSDNESLTIKARNIDGELLSDFQGDLQVRSGGEAVTTESTKAVGGVLVIRNWSAKDRVITVEYQAVKSSKTFAVASFLSLVPPIVAILLALWFRQVLISLFGGIWLGHTTMAWTQPDFDMSQFLLDMAGFLPALTDTMVGAVADADHAKIIFFTLLMGGMVGVISATGSMMAIVDIVSKKANTVRKALVATWGMGLLIFFDDYANTILVGNTMRPFTDRLRISREKLAYIVDSTAAPVAGLFMISTWIGYEIGLIDQMLDFGMGGQAYDVFFRSVPYRFYSILCLLMVLAVSLTGRDFGPMREAEIRARTTGKVLADGAKPLLDESAMEQFSGNKQGTWWMAAAPIFGLIVTILVYLGVTGYAPAQEKAMSELRGAAQMVGIDAEANPGFVKLWAATSKASGIERLSEKQKAVFHKTMQRANFNSSLGGILSEASSYNALVWGSGVGVLLAFLLALGCGFLDLEETNKAFMEGLKAMLLAVVVLTLAWSLNTVCNNLVTGKYLAELLKEVTPTLIPTLVFVMSAVIAFSTGTSWGTMAIIFPVLGPLLTQHMGALPAAHFEHIMLASVGAVLAGACFGDHASPISDTTVLSSMSSGADHIDHVRTQLPYASYCAVLAIVFGFLPAGYGITPFLTLPVAIALMVGGLYFIGERTDLIEFDPKLAAAQESSEGQAAGDEAAPKAEAESDSKAESETGQGTDAE